MMLFLSHLYGRPTSLNQRNGQPLLSKSRHADSAPAGFACALLRNLLLHLCIEFLFMPIMG